MRFSRPKRILLGLILLPIAVLMGSGAQQTSSSGLHHRSDENAAQQDQSPQNSGSEGSSTLPGDVSGPYHFDHSNESIEIDIEHSKLTGYISRLGDLETDSNIPLTFFFDKGSVHAREIEFQTRVVHGVWYSFHGTILRGEARTRSEEGYYVLHGTLQQHHPQNGQEKSADETVEKRVVNFKSMGG